MRFLIPVIAGFALAGCTTSEAAYRRLHDRLLELNLDRELRTQTEYRDAAVARLRGALADGPETRIMIQGRRPSYSASLVIRDLRHWTPAGAFISEYRDGSPNLRSDLERVLGEARAEKAGLAYWPLPTGVLVVQGRAPASAMFYPASAAELEDLVELPGSPSLPTRAASARHFSTATSSVRPLTKFTFMGDPAVQFWNGDTRELASMRRWERGPEAVSVSYQAPLDLTRRFGPDVLLDLTGQVGFSAHLDALRPLLVRSSHEDGLQRLLLDNIAYEIEGKSGGLPGARSLSVIACSRANVRQRQAEHGAPCSWQY